MNKQGAPINILRRGQITFYPINYEQHQDFYDEAKNVDSFLILLWNGLLLIKIKNTRFKATLIKKLSN